jgi:hypothetical protein
MHSQFCNKYGCKSLRRPSFGVLRLAGTDASAGSRSNTPARHHFISARESAVGSSLVSSGCHGKEQKTRPIWLESNPSGDAGRFGLLGRIAPSREKVRRAEQQSRLTPHRPVRSQTLASRARASCHASGTEEERGSAVRGRRSPGDEPGIRKPSSAEAPRSARQRSSVPRSVRQSE